MRKNTFRLFIILAAGLLTILANITAASACIASLYQPQVPKSLQNY